jgi:perosamine synthetase
MLPQVVSFIRGIYNTTEFIPLHAPVFSGREKEYVLETIDSTFVSSVGKFVDRFEQNIKEYTGAHYAVAIVNGTSALHMSLILADVKKEDLVITQSLSFIATCNAISYIEAKPLFIDVDKDTLGMSGEALRDYLQQYAVVRNEECFHTVTGQRIRACVPMHTFGHPVRIDVIADICRQYHIVLVEDAAESIGSTYQGRHTGTFGKLGAISFNGNKTITCGGGGVIITNDERIAKLGKHLTTQAKIPHRWNFEHDAVGYNYRMPNINAALACAQLEQLDDFVNNKRSTALQYRSFFQDTPYSFFEEPQHARSNYWLNAVLVNDKEQREAFLTYTNDNGVMTRPLWTLMHKLTMFRHCMKDDLSNSQWIEDRLINLPSSVIFPKKK